MSVRCVHGIPLSDYDVAPYARRPAGSPPTSNYCATCRLAWRLAAERGSTVTVVDLRRAEGQVPVAVFLTQPAVEEVVEELRPIVERLYAGMRMTPKPKKPSPERETAICPACLRRLKLNELGEFFRHGPLTPGGECPQDLVWEWTQEGPPRLTTGEGRRFLPFLKLLAAKEFSRPWSYYEYLDGTDDEDLCRRLREEGWSTEEDGSHSWQLRILGHHYDAEHRYAIDAQRVA